MPTDDVIRAYASVSDEWIERAEAFSSGRLLAPVADLLPQVPSRIADIGAGTGRDAAWLAGQGHDVVAVEPVARFRKIGMERHASLAIGWLDDRLPELARLAGFGAFDCVLVIGVWQHLCDEQRRVAMNTLARLTAAGGMLILSLRHGPGAPGRPVHQVQPETTIADADETGLTLVRRRAAGSLQAWNRAAGVHWTWLAFERRPPARTPPTA